MDLFELSKKRHSVRSYKAEAIPAELAEELNAEIARCNEESGLNVQLILNEPRSFDSLLSHYGKFSGVNNYIAIVGKDDKNLQELSGYYGEQIVLKAQDMGLNTCWVALSYSKNKCAAKIEKGEKLLCVISVGYGVTQGVPHKSKPLEKFYTADCTPGDLFMRGIECASLAPTAMNQQKFRFALKNGKVKIYTKRGFYAKLDMGIAKYHFEIGSENSFEWE